MALTQDQKGIALVRLMPGKKWILRGLAIDWLDTGVPPTEQELEGEYAVYELEVTNRQAGEDAIVAMRSEDTAALGTRAALIQEINDLANASPPMKAILRKLARVIYNREKGTID